MATLGAWVLGSSPLGGSNGGAVTEPSWLSRTSGLAARNGTTSHTISLGFTATANTLLVVVVHGPGAHSTAQSGWQERVSTTGTGELAVYTKFAEGGESTLTIDHSLSDIPMHWVAFQFPVGSGWLKWVASSPTTDVWPGISGMPSTEKVIVAVRGQVATSTSATTDITWGSGWVEDYDAITPAASGGTSGTTLTVAHRNNHTGTSYSISGYFRSGSGTFSTDRQMAFLALDVAPASATTKVTKTLGSGWAVRGRVTKTVASSWNVAEGLTSVSKTQASSWAVREPVQVSRASSWNVRESIARTQASSWMVHSAVLAAQDSSWSVRSAVQVTRSSAWNVRGLLSVTQDSSWSLREAVLRSQASSWNVEGAPGVVQRTQDSSWSVLSRVEVVQPSSWAVKEALVRSQQSAWAIRGLTEVAQPSSWGILERLVVLRESSWSLGGTVLRTQDSSWAVRVESATATIRVGGPFGRDLVLSGPKGRGQVSNGPHGRGRVVNGPRR